MENHSALKINSEEPYNHVNSPAEMSTTEDIEQHVDNKKLASTPMAYLRRFHIGTLALSLLILILVLCSTSTFYKGTFDGSWPTSDSWDRRMIVLWHAIGRGESLPTPRSGFSDSVIYQPTSRGWELRPYRLP